MGVVWEENGRGMGRYGKRTDLYGRAGGGDVGEAQDVGEEEGDGLVRLGRHWQPQLQLLGY